MSETNDSSSTPPEEAAPQNGAPGEAAPNSRSGPGSDGPDPLTAARDEAARLKDAWMRTAADFDNFRKRSRRELDDARRGGREDLLRELLPVFDNLERGMNSAQHA